MKKFYSVALLALLSCGLAFGQNAFIISTPITATADLVTPLGTDVTSDTAVYFNSDATNTLTGSLMVINPSGTAKAVKVRRTQLSVVSGSDNFFCWDLCYTSIVSVSGGTVNIPANDTVFVFYGDYEPNGYVGTTYINYKFYNNADTTQFASATIQYGSGLSGIEDQSVATISNVYPNPASQYITFDYSLGNSTNGSITIADITGKIVRSANLNDNTAKQVINLDGLNDGIYIYTFYSSGKAISTKRFIIKK